MFEKLKKIIFDENVELEPEDLSASVDQRHKESLDNNKNLIKATPLVKKVETEEEQPISKENVLKRIDVQPEQPVKPEPVVEPKPKVAVKKPVPKAPQFYKPKPVISPMFGLTSKDKLEVEIKKKQTAPIIKPEDDTVLSPIYGTLEEDTAELTIINNRKKKVVRKQKTNPQVNMSLEEMLNLNKNDDLEFTLFDVPVDKSEFQSRENTLINDKDTK